jgi:predicted phage tail protein
MSAGASTCYDLLLLHCCPTLTLVTAAPADAGGLHLSTPLGSSVLVVSTWRAAAAAAAAVVHSSCLSPEGMAVEVALQVLQQQPGEGRAAAPDAAAAQPGKAAFNT